MEKTHAYAATVTWTGNTGQGTHAYDGYGRNHDIVIAGKPVLEGSADPAFLGEAARHNPEDLLVAAISSCHMLWYLHLCAVAGVVVTDYVDAAEGTMEMDGHGAGQFTSVTLSPRVTIAPGSNPDIALAQHDKAHELCFIARSLNFPVACEAVIETGRRLIYIFDNTINRIEEGVFEAPPQAYDLTLRQIDTVRAVVDEVRRNHDIPRYKTEQLDRSLRELIERLEATRDENTG